MTGGAAHVWIGVRSSLNDPSRLHGWVANAPRFGRNGPGSERPRRTVEGCPFRSSGDREITASFVAPQIRRKAADPDGRGALGYAERINCQSSAARTGNVTGDQSSSRLNAPGRAAWDLSAAGSASFPSMSINTGLGSKASAVPVPHSIYLPARVVKSSVRFVSQAECQESSRAPCRDIPGPTNFLGWLERRASLRSRWA